MTNTMSPAHSNMVWQQVRPNEVSDANVLEALQQIDRAQFVSDDYKLWHIPIPDCRLVVVNLCGRHWKKDGSCNFYN